MVLSLDQAIEISKSIQLTEASPENNSSQGKARSENYELLESKVILDKNGLESIYILNQKNGDELYFSIISADLNTLPVLGYGEGIFDLETPCPETQYWLDGQLDLIEFVRDNNISKEEFIELVNGDNPSLLEGDGGVGPQNPCDDPLTAYGYRVVMTDGPLMSHTYGQECVYNDNCPEINCNIGLCEATEALTGCVATAMVQIMKHHEAPNNVPWSIMMDRYDWDDFDAPGADAVSDIMLNAGISVEMNYGCDESFVFYDVFEEGLKDVFENSFGYSYGGFYYENNDPDAWNDYTAVRSSIRNNRPVIVGGFGAEFEGVTGHIWVCDGTRSESFCDGKLNYHVNYFYHMNWGWNGDANGWSVGYGLFPESTIRVTNITP